MTAIAPATILILLLVNIWAFTLFGVDKNRARKGQRRIAERDLLGLALIGGSPGAFLGRHVFRHKTRKEPFSTWLQVIAMLQTGGMIGWWIA